MIWVNLFIFLLSIFIFIFNLLLLIAIGISSRLHSLSNLLSCNLWLANTIISVISIFQSLSNPYEGITFLLKKNLNNNTGKNFTSINIRENEYFENMYSFEDIESIFFTIAGPQVLASLFNSTISMLSLLGMAIVQIFGNRQNYLPR